MKKIFIRLILLIMLFLNLDSVSAVCYKITDQASNNNTYYSTSPVSGPMIISEPVKGTYCGVSENADCYKVTDQASDGSSYYSTSPVSGPMIISEVVEDTYCGVSENADCYKVTDQASNGSSYYSTSPVSGPMIISEPVDSSFCTKINFNNKTSCGNMGKFNRKIPEITSWIVTVVEIAVPVLLVLFGTIDFVKAIASQKDDEIKKGQQIFIKRLITGVIIFFVLVFTKLLVSAVSGNDEKSGILDCIDCFISNQCS